VLDGGQWYEAHVFETSGTLTFKDPAPPSITADYLIVGGGGGSGGGDAVTKRDRGGGGGAGGLLYQTGQLLDMSEGFVTVTVGTGGPGGVSQTQGTNGGDSSIRDITVPGGGGGGGAYNNSNGKSGGSGGGAGALNGSKSGTPGPAADKTDTSHPYGAWGYDGGKAWTESAGGGGGATGPGKNVESNNVGADGGPGWKPSDNDAAWITEVTGVEEFSRGGRGGSYSATETAGSGPGVNYGDGGSGSDVGGTVGAAGHDGIVIIRFKQ
jgi:hypothetical protein